ncbi:MAG TPA: MBL fold metallo-hydrolase [Polyangiaceae bacterium]
MRPEDIAWGSGALGGEPGPRNVRVRWLGTAGFEIEHDGHVVLVDPYVTRASIARCVLAPLRPDLEAVRRHAPRADAIVVGHTHFDHVLDVPAIARATGARVFGSRSASALCLAHGVPTERVEVVERDAGGEPVERAVGPFHLRFIPSAHSPLVLGRVPLSGEIADCGDVPMRVEAYRCGAVFGVEVRVAGRTIYHLGSAEILDADARVSNVDLLLMCVAGWSTSRDLPERVCGSLAPGAVLLSHWDDFLRPMERGARLLPAMQLPRLVDRLYQASPGVRIGTLPLLGDLWL